MPQLVRTPQEVTNNILSFQNEITTEMQTRLSYARAWYALQTDDGEWKFGPSKFIGYRNMTAQKYLSSTHGNELDGRKTEKKLKDWFVEVSENDEELWPDMFEKLSNFLDQYGKSPSSVIRINVEIKYYNQNSNQKDKLDADLIIAFINRLPVTQKHRIRNAIYIS